MKSFLVAVVIFVVLVLGAITAVFLHEKAYYAEKGQTRAEIRFLGFTNSDSSYLRLALFAVSNASPWAIVRTDYSTTEFLGANTERVGSFVGGSKKLKPHESEIAFVYLDKVEKQRFWRLTAKFDRYEDALVANMRACRFFLSDYIHIEVPRWDSIRVSTEWTSD